MALTDLRAQVQETNIAENLDKDLLEKIANQIFDGYDEDVRSRSKWEKKYSSYMELAMQLTENKTTPWQNAANVKYPLLTTAALQFGSRAYPALIPGVNVVKGRVLGDDREGLKTEKAIRIGKHMSYQLVEEMEEWEDDMDKMCVILPIIGCAFKKTYYSPIKQVNISELVLPSHLVVNYAAKSLEDAYRKTHVLELNANKIKERQLSGVYLDIDLGEPVVQSVDDIRASSDSIHGVQQESQPNGATPYTILEQHTFLDLDEDGYEEPYIVTIDKETKQVLRITARFDVEGIHVSDDGDKIIRIEPTEYFTKYGFIPAPDGGFYDIGFGHLLGPINATINSTINQLLDAGTLSNLQSGFVARGIRLKGGANRFTPGEWKTTNSTGDDLRKGIMPLPVREPSNVLFQLLGLMINAGERLSSTLDSQVGENPGQNQKATTTMIVQENGMKVFNGIYKRMYRSMRKEFKKLFRLNSIYLEEEDYFTILDIDSETGSSIKQEDYNLESFDVLPTADPTIATEQQRLSKAAGLLELLQMGLLENPKEVARRVLNAQEQPGIEVLLTPPEDSPPNLELIQMQDESKRDWARIDLEREKTQAQLLTAKSNALLAVAKAEATEAGTQLEAYKITADSISEDADRQLEALQLAQSNSGESKDGNGSTESK